MSEPPFTIRRVDHVVLRTERPEAMEAFYLAIGCTVARRRDDLGLQQLQAGASVIDLVDVAGPLGRKGGPPPGPDGRNLDHFALAIDPFDRAAVSAHLDAIGAPWVDPGTDLFGAEGIGPAIYATDPDGNTVELKGPARTAGTTPA